MFKNHKMDTDIRHRIDNMLGYGVILSSSNMLYISSFVACHLATYAMIFLAFNHSQLNNGGTYVQNKVISDQISNSITYLAHKLTQSDCHKQ